MYFGLNSTPKLHEKQWNKLPSLNVLNALLHLKHLDIDLAVPKKSLLDVTVLIL
jgi:hypothetical protein